MLYCWYVYIKTDLQTTSVGKKIDNIFFFFSSFPPETGGQHEGERLQTPKHSSGKNRLVQQGKQHGGHGISRRRRPAARTKDGHRETGTVSTARDRCGKENTGRLWACDNLVT